MPDATPPVNRYRRSSSRSSDKSAVLTSSKLLSTLQQWFPCGPLLAGHLTQSPPGLFLPRSRPSPSDNSRRRWFEVRSCKPTSRGRPSSAKQLRILLSCEIRVLMAHYHRQSVHYQLVIDVLAANPKLPQKNRNPPAPSADRREMLRDDGIISRHLCHSGFRVANQSCRRRSGVPDSSSSSEELGSGANFCAQSLMSRF
jgi:hypothetical protein